jgi:hypothetical protein
VTDSETRRAAETAIGSSPGEGHALSYRVSIADTATESAQRIDSSRFDFARLPHGSAVSLKVRRPCKMEPARPKKGPGGVRRGKLGPGLGRVGDWCSLPRFQAIIQIDHSVEGLTVTSARQELRAIARLGLGAPSAALNV